MQNFLLLSLLSLALILVYCWFLALVRILTGAYSKTEKVVWLILIFVFPIVMPILFFVLRDGRKPALLGPGHMPS